MRKLVLMLLCLCVLLVGCDGTGSGTTTSAPAQTTSGAKPFPTTKATGDKVKKTTAATQPPAVDEESWLTGFRETMKEVDHYCGVAFLDTVDGDFEAVRAHLEDGGYFDALPFLETIPAERFIEQEGSELYVILPADKDLELSVYARALDSDNEEDFELTELLYHSTDGLPVLMRGNVSEIFSNLHIEIVRDPEDTFVYSPALSMRDGYLEASELFILDMTPYELLRFPPEASDSSVSDVICGTWYARPTNAEDITLALTLELNDDGTLYYAYGLPYSENEEIFTGTWSEDEGILTLSMVGGPEGGETYEAECRFEWELYGRMLSLAHISGSDSFIFGSDGQVFDFMPFDAWQLAGAWSSNTETEDGELMYRYELRLYEVGEVTCKVYDASDVLTAGYDGYWSMEGSLLAISMSMNDGTDYDADEQQVISGSYEFIWEDADTLKLIHFDGDCISPYMEEFGEDYFWLD